MTIFKKIFPDEYAKTEEKILRSTSPVSISIIIILILIYGLYAFGKFKKIPCQNTIPATVARQFIHVNLLHLLSNVYAVWLIGHIEKRTPITQFLVVLVFLLVFVVVGGMVWGKMRPKAKCAIGFSSIIFGVFTWELMMRRKFDTKVLLAILVVVVLPTLSNPRASLFGHAVGAAGGVVAGLISKVLLKRK